MVYLQQPPFRVQSKAWVYSLLVKVLCNPFPARPKIHQDFFAGTLSWSPLQQRRGVTMGWNYNGKYIRLWMLAGSLRMYCCTRWLIQAQWQWAYLRYWLPCTFWTEDTYCNIIEELQYHEIRGRVDGSRTVSSRDCRGCSVLSFFVLHVCQPSGFPAVFLCCDSPPPPPLPFLLCIISWIEKHYSRLLDQNQSRSALSKNLDHSLVVGIKCISCLSLDSSK